MDRLIARLTFIGVALLAALAANEAAAGVIAPVLNAPAMSASDHDHPLWPPSVEQIEVSDSGSMAAPPTPTNVNAPSAAIVSWDVGFLLAAVTRTAGETSLILPIPPPWSMLRPPQAG